MENDVQNATFVDSSQSQSPKNGKGKVVVLVIAVLLIVTGVYLGIRNSKNTQVKKEVIAPTETPFPTEEPTATPEATVTIAPTQKPTPSAIPTTGAITSAFDMNIQVLNGSGVDKAAASAAAFLRDKGYKNLTTGNADTEDFTNVTVKVKSSRSTFLTTLVNHLKEKYTVITSSSDLSTDSSFDAQVIIGK